MSNKMVNGIPEMRKTHKAIREAIEELENSPVSRTNDYVKVVEMAEEEYLKSTKDIRDNFDLGLITVREFAAQNLDANMIHSGRMDAIFHIWRDKEDKHEDYLYGALDMRYN